MSQEPPAYPADTNQGYPQNPGYGQNPAYPPPVGAYPPAAQAGTYPPAAPAGTYPPMAPAGAYPPAAPVGGYPVQAQQYVVGAPQPLVAPTQVVVTSKRNNYSLHSPVSFTSDSSRWCD